MSLVTSSSSSFTSFPVVMCLNILSFLNPQDLIETAKTSSHFKKLTEHDLLWRPLVTKISLSTSNHASPITSEARKIYKFLSSSEICDELSTALPDPTPKEIEQLSQSLSQFCRSCANDLSLYSKLIIDPLTHKKNIKHEKYIKMLFNVYNTIIKRNDPSEIEIMKSCLREGTEWCFVTKCDEVERLFLAFVAQYKAKMPSCYIFEFADHRIELRASTGSDSVKATCSNWKSMYKSAIDEFRK